MTSYTTHFRIPIPDFNQTPWHTALQDVVRDLDQIVYDALVIDNVTTWANSTAYTVGKQVIEASSGDLYVCATAHTSATSPTTFAADRIAHPTYWNVVSLVLSPQGEWANSTAYKYFDLVTDSVRGILAICETPHTSSAGPATIITDTANWTFLLDLTSLGGADAIDYDNATSGLTAEDVQAAIDEVVALIASSLAAKASLASPAFTGSPTAPTPAVGDNTSKIATTAFVTAAIVATGVPYPLVQTRLVKQSATVLRMNAFNGNRIMIDDELRQFGTVDLAVGVLSDATYNIYAYWDGSAVKLEASTTTHQDVGGVRRKSGDITRTLVGKAVLRTGNWAGGMELINFYNRRNISGKGVLSSTITTSSGTPVELHTTETRLNFLTWAEQEGETLVHGTSCLDSNDPSFGFTFFAIGFDGLSPEDGWATHQQPDAAAAIKQTMSIFAARQLTEGAHYASLLGWSDGVDTARFYGTVAGNSTTIRAVILG